MAGTASSGVSAAERLERFPDRVCQAEGCAAWPAVPGGRYCAYHGGKRPGEVEAAALVVASHTDQLVDLLLEGKTVKDAAAALGLGYEYAAGLARAARPQIEELRAAALEARRDKVGVTVDTALDMANRHMAGENTDPEGYAARLLRTVLPVAVPKEVTVQVSEPVLRAATFADYYREFPDVIDGELVDGLSPEAEALL